MNKDLYVLSIRQPWAYLIMAGIKPVENRDWRTRIRGDILIHASTWQPDDEFISRIEQEHGIRIPMDKLQFGGVIGTVEVVGMVEDHPSPFFCGPVGWVLRNPRPCDFLPARGRPGLFRLPGIAQD